MIIILDILYNFGMLAAFGVLSGFINRKKYSKLKYAILQGLLFGVAGMLGMMKPVVLAEGLIFDGRSVMISLCGMFFGPIASAIAAVMAGIYRFNQGGPGAMMGISVIFSSAVIGSCFNVYLRNQKTDRIQSRQLLLMGVITHVVMILCMLALPKAAVIPTIKRMALPVIFIYPLATVVIGRILNEAKSRLQMAEELKLNAIKLRETNSELEASLEEIIAQEEEIQEQYSLLIESEDRFRRMFELAPIGINLSDLNTGQYLQVNKEFAKIVGRSQESLVGMSWKDVTHPDDLLENISLNLSFVNGDNSVFNYDKRYIKPDGETVWVNIKVILFPWEGSGIRKQLCFAEDITEQKKAHDALVASEHNFRTLFEGSADAILLFDESLINDCNEAALRLLKSDSKDLLIGKSPWGLSMEFQPDGENSMEKGSKYFKECLEHDSVRFEWCHLCFDGSLMPVEVVLTKIVLNGKVYVHALIRDITERKLMEEKLQFMSYRDQLTGIYNRRFFEEELVLLDVSRNLPFTIIIADVNGLKLINDSFGHPMGDQLLVKVSNCIVNGCRSNDVVSRIGGDEFAIILPKTTEEDAQAVIDRIEKIAASEKIQGLDISVSFGYSTKIHENESISEILKSAEDHMYKRKLFESPSIRSKTIETIIQTLYEKNAREEQHSHRVSSICVQMGEALGMLETELKELKSLGWLHDIGKIGIDESLLNKPGKLTTEERTELERHPEIGYRILSTMNEMSEMAEAVLAHHEKWDGSGYPRGLKEEQIPLKARIISIADAYDAMTSDRSYRKAMSHDYALEEIIKNAGTQFDPVLAELFSRVIKSC